MNLQAIQNGYDEQMADGFFNCSFDPIDDGNNEDDDGCSSECEIEVVLDVTWDSYGAEATADGVVVRWSTLEETGTLGFEVWSRSGPNRTLVQRVLARGAGNRYEIRHDIALQPATLSMSAAWKVTMASGDTPAISTPLQLPAEGPQTRS